MLKPDINLAKDRLKVNISYRKLDEKINKIVENKKYFLRTYGCQMNVHDSEQIRFYLESLGYIECLNIKEADIIVLNTCAIRENAKEKVFGFLSIAKHLKETTKPDLIVCLCGCLMQIRKEIDTLDAKHKYVDIIIGTHNIEELPQFIIKKYNQQVINVYSNCEEVIENIYYKRDSKITAWVNITYGCDNFCTYCIVPFTRGRERSRKKEEVINEIKCLKENGYKEVTLLGQNVNSYGKDLDENYLFSDLLVDVAKTGIERIRFVTSNPWNFTEEVIKVIAEYKNIMPYIHLPIQSGSNEILKRMNRKYTKEEYKVLFDKIKNIIPNVSITTDIIVGFPNETEADFNDTLEIVNYCKFDGAFTFIFSKREGTLAEKMDDNISEDVKKKRLQKLNTIVNKYSLENNKKLLNSVVPVLVLGISEKDVNKVYGYTDTMKLVNIKGGLDKIGEIINVKITDAKSFSLDGEIIR